MITWKELKTVLFYDPETGNFTWLDYPLPSGKARRTFGHACIGAKAGHQNSSGYVEIRYNEKRYYGHRLAWLYVYGEWPKEIDHINGHPNDNRICNLRLATRAQQNANTKVRRNNKTGLKGASKSNKRYASHIKIDGKSVYLGTFDTAMLAHEAYVRAAVKAHGEFARADSTIVNPRSNS